MVLYAASQRPQIVAGVVGLNPGGRRGRRSSRSRICRARSPTPNAGARRMAELLFKKTPMLLLADRPRRRARLGERSRCSASSPTCARERTGPCSRTRSCKDLQSTALCLVGRRRSPLAASERRRVSRSIPGARVELIPGCGHMPQLERPKLTSERVAGFIAGLSSRKSKAAFRDCGVGAQIHPAGSRAVFLTLGIPAHTNGWVASFRICSEVPCRFAPHSSPARIGSALLSIAAVGAAEEKSASAVSPQPAASSAAACRAVVRSSRSGGRCRSTDRRSTCTGQRPFCSGRRASRRARSVRYAACHRARSRTRAGAAA